MSQASSKEMDNIQPLLAEEIPNTQDTKLSEEKIESSELKNIIMQNIKSNFFESTNQMVKENSSASDDHFGKLDTLQKSDMSFDGGKRLLESEMISGIKIEAEEIISSQGK